MQLLFLFNHMTSQGKLIPINLPSAEPLLNFSSYVITPMYCNSLKLIEKTIVAANLGVTPSNDGEVIRVTVPPLTSDRRKVCVCKKIICALHFVTCYVDRKSFLQPLE
jgi:hypothetical protein